jgi:hypothetical protein
MRGQMTHPGPEVLAEFREGLISGRRGGKVAAHLAACDRCAALSDQLAEISGLLAAAPTPAMPGRVAARLDTVLAAETAKRDDSERAGGDRRRDRVTDTRPTGRRRFRLVAVRVLAPAAAVIVLAAGGYGLSRIGGGPTSSSGAGSKAARAPAAAGAAAGAAPANEKLSRSAAFPAIGSAGFKAISSRTDYQPDTLRQQLEQAISGTAKTATSRPPSAPLEACVQRMTRTLRQGTPVLVENALYQGRPATVIVASNGHGYTAWVMAPGCSATQGRVLAMTTLPGTSAP